MFEVEMHINENNAYYFHLYAGNGFNFIYPINDELTNYWKYVKGYYWFSSKGYEIYDNTVFKTIPQNDTTVLETSLHGYIKFNNKLIFEFPDEETAFYFKLKFC